MKAILLALAVSIARCDVATVGREPSPLGSRGARDVEHPVPVETLIAEAAPRWIRRSLPFSNTAGAALVPVQDGSIILVVDGATVRSTDLGKTWETAPVSGVKTLYTNDGGRRFVDIATARRTWFLEPVEDLAFETVATTIAGDRLFVLARGQSTRRLSSLPIPPASGPILHRVFAFDGPITACLASSGTRVFAGGVTGGHSALFESVDAGRSWRPAWRRRTRGPIPVALTFHDLRHGRILMSDGAILQTLDGCESWLASGAVPLDCAPELVAMGWANERVGYAVGRGGLILATRDGGRVWERCRSTVDSDLNAVLTVSTDEAWVVGTAGVVLRSGNGGATWSRIDLGIGENLRSISYFARSVWIVGDGSLWIFPD